MQSYLFGFSWNLLGLTEDPAMEMSEQALAKKRIMFVCVNNRWYNDLT